MKWTLAVAALALGTPLLLSFAVDGWLRVHVGSQFSLEQIPDMTGKTAIITGPTVGGIGYVSALELARKGAHVIMAGRSAKKGQEAVDGIKKQLGEKADIHFQELDLSDLNSVKHFAEAFAKTGKPLHILMNNAGVMACPFSLTKQGIEMQFGTNHVGHYLLAKKLLPALKQGQPSRIVSVSSAAHYMPEYLGLNMTDVFAESEANYGPWSAYGRSKLANVLFAAQLDKELEGTKVFANSCHPGGIKTNLQVHLQKSSKESMGEMLSGLFNSFFESLLMSPEDGAVTQLFLATSPRVETENIRGQYFHPQARPTKPSGLVTPEEAQRLWAFSEKLVAGY